MASKYISSFKLPSKKVIIFFGTCAGISSLIYRDNKLSKEAKIIVKNKVSKLALEPLNVHELPRKVTVYLAPPLGDGIHKTKIHFREYVKPVLNAAALEYDVVEGTQPGQIRSKVREAIREKRKQESSPPQSSSTVAASDQTFKIITPSKPIDGGTIVIGRVSLVEYLQGLNEGCIASLEDIPPKQPKSDSDSAQSTKVDQQPDTNQNNNNNNESKPEFIINEKDFSVPELDPIGYIHFYNRIGWKNIILRLYYAFNSYKEFDIAGEETVKIAYGNTRKFTKDDLNLGKDEEEFFKGTLDEPTIDERILEKLSIYT
ncbi:mitochondrial import inner membrane translocase subunit Tim54 [Glomus cerebriforme]|uniref:Mitochondrial import inner membrane translocase subunit TIM54 n=1 Tax=Glomus cerebriforme TaxID=658196 RepID=A0A397TQC6_9GLOM|nr:mitochondrial import inner membrane translocase subunit Tim54 [Glomus cerebriforme]